MQRSQRTLRAVSCATLNGRTTVQPFTPSVRQLWATLPVHRPDACAHRALSTGRTLSAPMLAQATHVMQPAAPGVHRPLNAARTSKPALSAAQAAWPVQPHRCASTTATSPVGRHAQHDMLQSKPPAISEAERSESITRGSNKRIRSFSIIAHIDHGKSTLSDRLLEYTSSIDPLNKSQAQVLDNLQVERDRGITVRAQTSAMWYRDPRNQQVYQLNLIDTPGHVDFGSEVTRALAACDGALLVVDASQGIQAQTLANYSKALEHNLEIIPVLTKIDLPHSDVEGVKQQLYTALDIDPDTVLCVSNKTGQGIEQLFPRIIDDIPAPSGSTSNPFRGLLFDAYYDTHRGVVCLLEVADGYVRKGDRIASYHANKDGSAVTDYEVQEIGLLTPAPLQVDALRSGQAGYVICGIKTKQEIKLGDTYYKTSFKKSTKPLIDDPSSVPANYLQVGAPAVAYGVSANATDIEPLPGFTAEQAMVFAGLYPSSSNDFESLSAAIDKLTLNDSSVRVERESSVALGMGFRCGFLGVLHLQVFTERLSGEFASQVIITAPTVKYKAVTSDNTEVVVDSPSKYIEPSKVQRYLEPTVIASIITPTDHLGTLLTLCEQHRGQQLDIQQLTSQRVLLKYKLPLGEIVVDFYDSVKSLSQGYASLDYEASDYEEVDLCNMEMRINGEAVDALSVLCERSEAQSVGRKIAEKLKDVVDRQAFEVVIQAAIGNKVIARERIAPYRKDVLVKGGKTVGGGDITRKRKLLEKQKEGKKRMKAIGNVELNEKAFAAVMQIK